MKFSILGPGNIAKSLARAVQSVDGVVAYAVASRSYERAKTFADEWGLSLIHISEPTRPEP